MLHTPRHAAPRGRRALLLPAVLLLSSGVATTALAVVPAAAAPTASVVQPTADRRTPSPVRTDRLLQAWRSGASDDRAARERVTRAAWERAARAAAHSRAVALRASRARRVVPPAPAVVRPGVGPLTSRYGPRWGRLHAGIDLAAGVGAPVSAVAAGVVRSAGSEGGYGNVVRVEHPQGTLSLYAHLSEVLVAPGQSVAAGERIGSEGNSGHSTGPHLHFEVRIDDVPVDPLAWLQQRGLSL